MEPAYHAPNNSFKIIGESFMLLKRNFLNFLFLGIPAALFYYFNSLKVTVLESPLLFFLIYLILIFFRLGIILYIDTLLHGGSVDSRIIVERIKERLVAILAYGLFYTPLVYIDLRRSSFIIDALLFLFTFLENVLVLDNESFIGSIKRAAALFKSAFFKLIEVNFLIFLLSLPSLLLQVLSPHFPFHSFYLKSAGAILFAPLFLIGIIAQVILYHYADQKLIRKQQNS